VDLQEDLVVASAAGAVEVVETKVAVGTSMTDDSPTLVVVQIIHMAAVEDP